MIVHEKIVAKCQGCNKVRDNLCTAYYSPKAKWRLGNCPLASHIVPIVEQVPEKKRAGQQKQKKNKKG